MDRTQRHLGTGWLVRVEAAGMTQIQMARRLGVKKSTIASWENDLSEPRANRLSMMAGMVNVSIMWLLTGEGEGMDAPAEAEEGAPELADVVAELRAIRGEMRANAERAAKLEEKTAPDAGAGPMTESRDIRIKRLKMRSMRRGIKEMDLILSAYADRNLPEMGASGLDTYDALLHENDQDLYQWVTGQVQPPEPYADLISDIAQTFQK